MKQLVCEMCGGTDIVKQDGVFVCQNCGIKYSLEEARKMMIEGTVEVKGTVEIKGSVKVDNSGVIDGYRILLDDAIANKDLDTIVKYTTKILELDVNNYEACVYRAKSSGWNSTLNNIKIPLTTVKQAIQLAPEDKKAEVADDLYETMQKQLEGLLYLSQNEGLYKYQYVKEIMGLWLDILQQTPCLSAKAIDAAIAKVGDICKTHPYIGSSAVNHYLYEKGDNGFEQIFKKSLKDRVKIAVQEEKERTERYWAIHSEEKERLEAERESLLAQIEAITKSAEAEIKIIEKEYDTVSIDNDKLSKINEMIESLVNEKKTLGVFKVKEKKTIQDKIDELNGQIIREEQRVSDAKAIVDKKIKDIRIEANKESYPLQLRLKEIEFEFTKIR